MAKQSYFMSRKSLFRGLTQTHYREYGKEMDILKLMDEEQS